MEESSLIKDGVLKSLVKFALLVLLAMFLQSLYRAVDLLVVGQFASTADVSGVAIGSMLMHTITMIITGLSMGVTIYVGQKIGEDNKEETGKTIGTGIVLFAIISIILTIFTVIFTSQLASMLHAPAEAFKQTCEYILVCGSGLLFIGAYKLLGAIFRGIGDAKNTVINCWYCLYY